MANPYFRVDGNIQTTVTYERLSRSWSVQGISHVEWSFEKHVFYNTASGMSALESLRNTLSTAPTFYRKIKFSALDLNRVAT